MIQFNLLPEVKIEYIKAQKMRQLFTSVSILVTIVTIVIFVISFGANQLEKKHLNDLNKDIKTETSQLKAKPQIDKILTVQNQLTSLTTLHNAKPAVPRLFNYLDQLTPNQASINSLSVDFNLHTATLVGSADGLVTVNKFVDTMKFTKYAVVDSSIPDDLTCQNFTGANYGLSSSVLKQVAKNCADSNGTSIVSKDDTNTAQKAFSGVVLSAFSAASGTQASSYTITFSYDPTIFDGTKKIRLIVPSIITTRSEVDKPSNLFTKGPANQTPSNPGGQ